jgi:hypothetical protein
MSRVILAAVGWPLLLSFACSAPFTAASDEQRGTPVTVDDATGGDAEVSDTGRSGRSNTGGLPSAGRSSGDAGEASGPSGVGGDGNEGGRGAVSAPACPDLPGEKLVRAGRFCIDETEVTAASYQAFVDSKPSVAEQPYECLGNPTFANGCAVANPTKEPVRCVDWCDARAYCASVGKRLCGADAESDGGAMPFDAPATAAENQWYSACSHAGELAYPYGEVYDEAACWGTAHPPVGALAVKSAPGCSGGYAGLFDMSGGLAEWVDSCNAEKGMSDGCRIRGGSYSATPEQMRCDWQSATPRDTISNYIGIRCCADLTIE